MLSYDEHSKIHFKNELKKKKRVKSRNSERIGLIDLKYSDSRVF